MALGIGYSSNDGADGVILPPREHACELLSVRADETTDFNDPTKMVPQLKFVFSGLQWKSPEGKEGFITCYTGVRYGFSKAKLTGLLDSFFGRSLTEDESKRIDIEKLVGMKGYVMVLPHTKQDGTKTSKYGGFRFPDGKGPLNPSDYFADNYSAGGSPSPSPAPTPKDTAAVGRDPFEDGGDADNPDGLEDPFSE